jgi:hypothetical protein
MGGFYYTRERGAMAALLVCIWTFAFMLPLIVWGPGIAPPATVWVVAGTLAAYFAYSGIRALKKGWKSRFILRVVVPICLFVASSVLWWTGLWSWISS